MIFDFKLHTPNSSDTPLPRFFFVRACMRGFCSRARSDPQQNEEFLGAKRTHRRWWEHTQVCGHVHTTRRVVSRAAERSGECATKKKKSCTLRVHSHAHAHAHTCTCRRACTHAHTNVRAESAHTCTCTYAPAGCMKSTHPKRNDRSKARSRKT